MYKVYVKLEHGWVMLFKSPEFKKAEWYGCYLKRGEPSQGVKVVSKTGETWIIL